MKNKVEKQSNVIVKMFQQMHPSYYSCHIREDLVILCQSSNGNQMSKFIADFLNNSLIYYLNNILPNSKLQQVSTQQYHKANLANLLVSCREQIQQLSIQGSCSFGFCFVYNDELYSMRSEGVQMYLLDQHNYKIWSVNSSTDYLNSKRSRNKNIQEPYFKYNMGKIKAEYIYEQNDNPKKQIYFQKLPQQILKQGENLKVLIGCTQTFDIVTPDFLFKYFKDNSERSDCEKVSGLLQQAKKKIKSIHNLDLSLVCWKLNISLQADQNL